MHERRVGKTDDGKDESTASHVEVARTLPPSVALVLLAAWLSVMLGWLNDAFPAHSHRGTRAGILTSCLNESTSHLSSLAIASAPARLYLR